MLRHLNVHLAITRPVLLATPLILIGLYCLGHFIRWGTLEPSAPVYNHGQFLFDYRDWGFVKRGLVASLFPQTPETVGAFTAWFSAVFCAVIILASTALIWLTRQPVAMLVVMASPFFIYTLGYDLGKLDVVAIAWFLGWLILRETGRARAAWIAYSLSPLLLFVHEGFLLMILPVFALVENLARFELRRNLLFAANSLVIFAGIWAFGHAHEHADAINAFFEGQYGPDYLAHDVLIIGFRDNLMLAYEKHLADPNGHSALTVLVFLSIAALYPMLFQMPNAWIYALVVLGFAAMFVLGSDWARWTALFASLVGIGLASAARLRGWAEIWIERLMLPLLLVSIALMPAGMVLIFQELESLLRQWPSDPMVGPARRFETMTFDPSDPIITARKGRGLSGGEHAER